MAVIRWGSETQITEVDWLWKPLIPFGKVTLIEGDGGDEELSKSPIWVTAPMLQPSALQRG